MVSRTILLCHIFTVPLIINFTACSSFYLFMAVLGLRCCVGFSLSAPVGASVVVEHGLLRALASVAAARRLNSCGSQALEHRLSS